MRALSTPIDRDLVLVGGGHAHVQVLRRLMMRPEPGVRTTVVLDRAEAVYSGMVPGFVAGDYAAHELEIDVVPLARRAGANVVLSPATRIDPVERRIELEDRPALRYDVASLDVGSTVRGLALPGVAEHALSTRPIRDFVDRLDARLARGGDRPQIAVIGAGAAGVELAFTVEARLRAAGRAPRVVLVSDSAELLHPYAQRVGRRLRQTAQARGIDVRLGVRVARVEPDAVHLAGAEPSIPCDLPIWATGAAPLPLLAASPLPLDHAGFVQVEATLQVLGHDALFAVGDCASIGSAPWVRKAGVYAVRAGPVLDHNLRARLAGRPLRRFRPQRDFLSLLNLGGRTALAVKWGRTARGPALWKLKDFIDRRFMNRFQVLDAEGARAPDFPTPESMGMPEMECGGCAAKVGVSPLTRALGRLPAAPDDASVEVGLRAADDAALLALPGGDRVLATLDAFPAFCDDPWLVGRIAAVNAMSDVHAKGGMPRHALALVTVADADPERAEETLYQVLAGVRAALDPEGVSLVGGHTTRGEELFVGLSITGGLPDGAELLPLGGCAPGETLILTKALGTGVLLAADMRGELPGRQLRTAIASMLRTNRVAAEVARRHGASACTDVSGFGLAGHLGEMVQASGTSANLHAEALPALPGARALLARGVRSTFHEQNAEAHRGIRIGALPEPSVAELLFDPQTAGGLLFSVGEARAEAALAALHDAGAVDAGAIGSVGEALPGVAFSLA